MKQNRRQYFHSYRLFYLIFTTRNNRSSFHHILWMPYSFQMWDGISVFFPSYWNLQRTSLFSTRYRSFLPHHLYSPAAAAERDVKSFLLSTSLLPSPPLLILQIHSVSCQGIAICLLFKRQPFPTNISSFYNSGIETCGSKTAVRVRRKASAAYILTFILEWRLGYCFRLTTTS